MIIQLHCLLYLKKTVGGWLVTYPDLLGCISDGETPEEALKNGRDALESRIEANKAENRPIPLPNSASGKFVTRLPKITSSMIDSSSQS